MPQTKHVVLRAITDNSYPIHIGVRLADCPRRITRSYPALRYFIITDSNVRKLYAAKFLRGMKAAGANAALISVPPGERSKSRAMKSRIEDRLFALHADRDSLVIAVGGGMIGDLAGFVASTLQRGIRYIQIPTTLLSQVDSSVGGKVGIDHPRGKNLIGAFHQPSAVYIDPATLRTLPEFEFSGGMAEVIKYGAILDAAFFGYLERHRSKILRKDPAALRSIIGRCCTLKAEVVRRDEKESSYRRILNFGHTIGHAVEALSHFRIAHGQAVAIGMCCEAKIARELGLITAQECARLIGLIRDMRLPTRLPAKTNLDRLIERTKSDKKSRGGAVRYTLLEAIGRGSIDIMPRNIKQLIMR